MSKNGRKKKRSDAKPISNVHRQCTKPAQTHTHTCIQCSVFLSLFCILFLKGSCNMCFGWQHTKCYIITKHTTKSKIYIHIYTNINPIISTCAGTGRMNKTANEKRHKTKLCVHRLFRGSQTARPSNDSNNNISNSSNSSKQMNKRNKRNKTHTKKRKKNINITQYIYYYVCAQRHMRTIRRWMHKVKRKYTPLSHRVPIRIYIFIWVWNMVEYNMKNQRTSESEIVLHTKI